MIDIEHEHLLTIKQITEKVPSRPHPGTIWRWYKKGLRGGIKLETILIGGRRMTSREALQRFAQRTTTQADGVPPPSRTAKQRQRAKDEADKVLKKAGIL